MKSEYFIGVITLNSLKIILILILFSLSTERQFESEKKARKEFDGTQSQWL